MADEWMNGTCEACEGGIGKEGLERILQALEQLSGWEYKTETDELRKTFRFKNFHQTMAFVNAVAWIAHQQDHHPEMIVGYKTCEIAYTTHSAGGVTRNDFICAAAINRLCDV